MPRASGFVPRACLILFGVLANVEGQLAQTPMPRRPTGIPARIYSGAAPPNAVFILKPDYPAAAITAHTEGLVICELVVGVDGRVRSTRVLRTVPELMQAVVDAAQQWRFEPTRFNGDVVEIVFTKTVQFSLSDLSVTVGGEPPSRRLADGAAPPKRTKYVAPIYPARTRGTSQPIAMRLEVVVGSTGNVRGVRILEHTSPAIERAIIEAVRQWTYAPTRIDGVATDIAFEITIPIRKA